MEPSFSLRPWNATQRDFYGEGRMPHSTFPHRDEHSGNVSSLKNSESLSPSLEETPQRLRSRQLRLQLQQSLLREERGESGGEQHAGSTIRERLSTFCQPEFFQYASLACLGVFVFRQLGFSGQRHTVENVPLFELDQSAANYPIRDPFLFYMAAAFGWAGILSNYCRISLEKPKISKEQRRLNEAGDNFVTDLEIIFRKGAVGNNNKLPGAVSPDSLLRNIRSLAGWIGKIRDTAEARVRPEHLAERLDVLRLAVFHDDDADSGLEEPESRKAERMELRSACYAIATAFDASCNDAAMEALEDMEAMVKTCLLKRLPADRFLDEARAMFKEGLLKEVADEIGKWEHRKPGEELEAYLELKSLLSGELCLGTQNKYMEFRTISRIKGEEAEYALDYVNKKNTDDDFIEFLSGRFRQTYEDFLRDQFPVFSQWHKARAEWYADKLFDAGKQASEGRRIEETSSLINRKNEEEKQVMQDYARCLMSGNQSQLKDLERRLKKSLPAVELI